MKNKILVISLFFLWAACDSNDKNIESKNTKVANGEKYKENLVNEIKTLEAKMDTSKQLDNVLAGLAIKAYSDFAYGFPDDERAPECLFKAGRIATNLKQYPQAIIYYQTICNKYPDFPYVADCLYLQGFVYDYYLEDDTKAKEIYEKVIDQYPKTRFAEDAKASISNFGKSEEELIDMYEKKKNKKGRFFSD